MSEQGMLLGACGTAFRSVSSVVYFPARQESKKGRMADALAHGGDEGRDKLR